MADGDLHLSSRRVGIALQGMLQRCPKAAREVVVVVRGGKGGEEERGGGGGGLCLDLRTPSDARPVPFPGPLTSPFGTFASAVLRTTITGKDGDDSQSVNRVIQAYGTHCYFCYVWI